MGEGDDPGSVRLGAEQGQALKGANYGRRREDEIDCFSSEKVG